MSVADIADLLTRRLASGRLTAFRSGDRTAPQRHQTLEAVIGWSWDLLDDDARSLLRTMCRFPSGFTADAVHDVMGVVAAADSVVVDDALDRWCAQVAAGVDETTVRRGTACSRWSGSSGTSGCRRRRRPRVEAAMARWAAASHEAARDPFDAGANREAAAAVSAESDNLVLIVRPCLDPRSRCPAARCPRCGARDLPRAGGELGGARTSCRGAVLRPRVVAVLATPRGLDDERTREKWLAAL